MAISKILHMNPYKRSMNIHLKQGIEYITNNKKTEEGLYVGAVNCPVDKAFEYMMETKKMYGKTDKRQGYHLIISFEENETTPEIAFEIAREFTEKYLAENYEAIYSVHTDTDHIHCHIIWNSVRFSDGYKYRYEKGDWERFIQPLVNEICEKHGLNTLDITKKQACDIVSQGHDNDQEWDVSRDGAFVWSEQIKKDVDACIIQAADFDMFIQLMEDKKYQVKYGKYISVKPVGMQRFRRLKTLGPEYSEEMIKKRIDKETITQYRRAGITQAPKIIGFKGSFNKKKHRELTGLQKQYFAILYRLGKIKKRSYSNYSAYKDDVKKFKLLQKQYLFLSKYNIKTEADLESAMQNVKTRIKTITKAKKVIVNENEKYSEIFNAVAMINKEKKAATFYKLGDKTFEKQFEAMEKAKSVLLDANLTYQDARRIESHYQDVINQCIKETKTLQNEMKIAYSLKKDIAYRKEQAEIRRLNDKTEIKDKQQACDTMTQGKNKNKSVT